LIVGEGSITVTGSGSGASPYVITGGGELSVLDSDTVDLTLTGDGSTGTPYVLSADAVVEMEELTNFDPTGGSPGDVVALNPAGDGYVLQPPSTATPGALVTGAGLSGDGSGGDPLRVDSTTSTYVPDWTATTTNPDIGSGSIDGRYTVWGKWVDLSVQIVLAADTAKGSGTYGITLPVDALAGRAQIIPLLVTYPNGTIRTGVALTNGGSSLVRLYISNPTSATGSTVASSSTLSTLSSGGRIILTGRYEMEP
jgi:hypothetical protein